MRNSSSSQLSQEEMIIILILSTQSHHSLVEFPTHSTLTLINNVEHSNF
jgi:hypothetical protein